MNYKKSFMLSPSLFTVLLALVAGIGLIILLSTRFKMHPFFSLSLACFVTGWLGGLDAGHILASMKEGFGKIMSSLGFIIVLGTALGLVLQSTGATTVMANTIIKWVGTKKSVLAISLTGMVVGLPIFCDSGYVVLNGLNKSMIKKTGIPAVIMSTALATGLYSVHCFIPPHPGVTAATGTVAANYGWVILYGLLAAIPAMLAGYFWAVWKGKKMHAPIEQDNAKNEIQEQPVLPGKWRSFLPVLLPILLIALKAIIINMTVIKSSILNNLLLIGDPAIALSIGLIIALCIPMQWKKEELGMLVHHSIEKAGGILMIIGTGSAFGTVINTLKIQDYLVHIDGLNALGILFPFMITVILKTAQGSSTVAIITAASIILPFLPGLHLDTDNGRVLTVLAMGAGSMAVSHVNDAYFWVIANFSNIELKSMLRVYSIATILMSITAMVVVYLLSLFIL